MACEAMGFNGVGKAAVAVGVEAIGVETATGETFVPSGFFVPDTAVVAVELVGALFVDEFAARTAGITVVTGLEFAAEPSVSTFAAMFVSIV